MNANIKSSSLYDEIINVTQSGSNPDQKDQIFNPTINYNEKEKSKHTETINTNEQNNTNTIKFVMNSLISLIEHEQKQQPIENIRDENDQVYQLINNEEINVENKIETFKKMKTNVSFAQYNDLITFSNNENSFNFDGEEHDDSFNLGDQANRLEMFDNSLFDLRSLTQHQHKHSISHEIIQNETIRNIVINFKKSMLEAKKVIFNFLYLSLKFNA